jgi:23S rRNA pseudouridine1911/1915/1917 synthase
MGLFPKHRDLTKAPTHVELTVDASGLRMRIEDVDIRLDAFLVHHLTWRSRASIQELIRDGFVLVDASSPDRPRGRGECAVETRPGRKLKHGSRVVVTIPEELRLPMLGPSSDELVVLYEDEAIVAVEKPANLAVHPSGRHMTDTLIQRVHARYGQGHELERGGAPRLCHRLDRETSGIVLVGKNPIAHSDVMGQFERREVEKEYLAIVRGVPDAAVWSARPRDDRDAPSFVGGTIDYPIGSSRTSDVELKMAVIADGLPSRTDWRLVQRARGCALVACSPHTGRQHQIRVHLAAIGHPVVGDKLYGHDEDLFEKSLDGELSREDLRALGMPRQALHNHRVAFVSPATCARVEVVSALPQDMAAYLAEHAL